MINLKRDMKNKKSIMTIQNSDQLCLARTISICMARHEIDSAISPTTQRKAKRKYQTVKNGDQGR